MPPVPVYCCHLFRINAATRVLNQPVLFGHFPKNIHIPLLQKFLIKRG